MFGDVQGCANVRPGCRIGRSSTRQRNKRARNHVSPGMKSLRAAALILVLIALAGWTAHAVAPWASDRLARATLRTAHFRITSPPADAALAGRVAAVLESEYRRVSSALSHDLRRPVNVRVTSSRLLYNLSCGLPFPAPPGDGFDGAAGDRGVTILIPRDWNLGTETAIPDRGRTLAIHEVTHMLIFEINPAVLGQAVAERRRRMVSVARNGYARNAARGRRPDGR